MSGFSCVSLMFLRHNPSEGLRVPVFLSRPPLALGLALVTHVLSTNDVPKGQENDPEI